MIIITTMLSMIIITIIILFLNRVQTVDRDLTTQSSHRCRRREHDSHVVLLKDAIERTRIWSSDWFTL